MAVIINEFEVVAPPPGQSAQPPSEQPAVQQNQPPQPPKPEDVERIMNRFAQRQLRLWAD
jgi:hypothetical protein